MSLITPDFGLLVWMVLIFGIVFFILAKFAFPIITGMVDKRAERINESISKAREAEERLAALAVEQEKMIEQARLEQGRILKEAADARDAIVARARQQASEDAAGILAKAKKEIETERESAINDIRREVAMLSVNIAEKIVRKELDTSGSRSALIERLMDEVSEIHTN